MTEAPKQTSYVWQRRAPKSPFIFASVRFFFFFYIKSVSILIILGYRLTVSTTHARKSPRLTLR